MTTRDITVIRPGEGPIIAAGMGDEYQIKITRDLSAGALLVMDAAIEPGGGPPLHVHLRDDEWFSITTGEVAFWNGREAITAGPGAFVYIPRGRPHTFKNRSTAPARMLIGVTPADAEDFFRAFGQLNPDGTHPSDMEIGKRILALAPRFGLEILGPNPL